MRFHIKYLVAHKGYQVTPILPNASPLLLRLTHLIIIISFLEYFSHKDMFVAWVTASLFGAHALFEYLAELINAEVCIISIFPLVSSSSSFFSYPLWIGSSTQTIIGITVTRMFLSIVFISFSGKVQVFVYLFAFFLFFLLSGPLEQPNPQDDKCFFPLVNQHSV